MNVTLQPAPVWCLPPWLKERKEPGSLEERVLWWVARARWIHVQAVSALAASTHDQASSALWRLSSARQVRILHQRLLLTNGGLGRLAERSGLRPRRLGQLLGWGWDAGCWREQGPEEIADTWYDANARLGAHRLAVLDLLGRAAAETRPEAFWKVALRQVWVEREVAGQIRQTFPRPDAYLEWEVRGGTYRYCLELEQGSQRMGALVQKMDDYAWYAANGAFPERWKKVPGVLLICPTAAYETRLSARLEQARQEWPYDMPILLTHQGWLREFRLMDSIWRAPGAQPVAGHERVALWGKDDPQLMQHQRYEAEWRRSPLRYRTGGRA
jgi:hypothetical protein